MQNGFSNPVDIASTSDGNAFSPLRLALFRLHGQPLVNGGIIVQSKFLQVAGPDGTPHFVQVNQSITSSLADQFVIAAPFPLPRMPHGSSPYHVEIDVGQTSPQVGAVFDHRGMIPVLPESATPPAAQIVGQRVLALHELHQSTHLVRVRSRTDEQVNVVGSDDEVEDRYVHLIKALAESLPVIITVPGKPEQERPIMTSMC